MDLIAHGGFESGRAEVAVFVEEGAAAGHGDEVLLREVDPGCEVLRG